MAQKHLLLQTCLTNQLNLLVYAFCQEQVYYFPSQLNMVVGDSTFDVLAGKIIGTRTAFITKCSLENQRFLEKIRPDIIIRIILHLPEAIKSFVKRQKPRCKAMLATNRRGPSAKRRDKGSKARDFPILLEDFLKQASSM